MHDYQLPLVLFTVMSQWGIGAVLALSLYQWQNQSQNAAMLSTKALRTTIALIWLIEVVGSSMSMGHLGDPLGAYRSVLGIAHSWLSREAIAFVMLNGLISLWALASWVQPNAIRRNSLIGLFCGVIGLPIILVTAQIYYQMQAHPLWHTPATQISFIGTALLLGFGSMIPWLRLQGKAISNSLKIGTFIGALLVFVGLVMRAQVPGADVTSLLLWWQVIASLIVGICIITLSHSASFSKASLSVIAILMLFSGEITGRMLFYSNVMSQAPWF
ncbi:dimethyl sulfoxide reductase anchor subunit family protein [Proteus terrae]|uniref:Dimethyl sulfoxide reductase anchor subunit n=1 Tax=Proteus terrae subsp. cibarius TaxID=626774 RepID=A0A8I0WQP2_9GAMM|nr:DmsC/YnfH family molybdoenzyme membrane anchor subunit [Proteus terrae]MBG2913543.1 dimethyl sulfoxide reductase anchor subunit [Proteus terrae subsp. cibarius]